MRRLSFVSAFGWWAELSDLRRETNRRCNERSACSPTIHFQSRYHSKSSTSHSYHQSFKPEEARHKQTEAVGSTRAVQRSFGTGGSNQNAKPTHSAKSGAARKSYMSKESRKTLSTDNRRLTSGFFPSGEGLLHWNTKNVSGYFYPICVDTCRNHREVMANSESRSETSR